MMFNCPILTGNYIRYDLNMPKCLPKRKGGAQDFYNDSPLTVQGHFQAKLVGELQRQALTLSFCIHRPGGPEENKTSYWPPKKLLARKMYTKYAATEVPCQFRRPSFDRTS